MLNNNKKNILSIIASFFIVSGCSASENIYVNEEYGYQISLPKSWCISEKFGYLRIKEPNALGYRCSLTIEQKPDVEISDSKDLVNYVKAVFNEHQNKRFDYKINKIEELDINNIPSAKIIFSNYLKEEVAKQMNETPRKLSAEIGVYSLNSEKLFYFNCSGIIKDYEFLKSKYETIVNSVAFVDKNTADGKKVEENNQPPTCENKQGQVQL